MPDLAPSVHILPGGVPEPGELRAVAPGVFWLRMPLPLALDHVNLWLLEDGEGWCIIDTGLDSEAARALWLRVLQGPLAGRPVTRMIVTHYHPDHAGLAGWLWQHPLLDRPPLIMTSLEYLTLKALQLDDSESYDRQSEWFYRAAGMAEERIAFYSARGNRYRASVHEMTAPFVQCEDGDVLRIGGREWRVITGGGHALDMIMLHCAADGLFLSGDQVLPFISPNVSVWPMAPFADPLTAFDASLRRLMALPDDVLVLPCHGQPFKGLHARIGELLSHHAQRLAEITAACQGAMTASQVSDILFNRPLDDFQRLFAMGETVAHLNHLVAKGALEREQRRDAAWLYSTSD